MRYIGSKANLLGEIEALIRSNTSGDERTFFDVFAGTNAVGSYFKPSFQIFTNDTLRFSYVDACARIAKNSIPVFSTLRAHGIASPLRFLQEGAESYIGENNVKYYEQSYSPTGGAMYLTVENAKRIDFIRDTIDMWFSNGWISETEKYYLVDCLIAAIPSVSNTTGTYGAFLKHWDKRALKALRLKHLDLYDNNRENKCYNTDSNKIVDQISADILYIDPPYNSRQYASNYHLLENVATNNKPDLHGRTRIFDWGNLRSPYSSKSHAHNALEELLHKADARHIVISYSSEGIISEENLLNIARANSLNGKLQLQRIPYRKYKSKVPSDSYDLYEYLVYIQKRKTSAKGITSDKYQLSNQPPRIAQRKKYIKSPLNYIGGKYKLLGQILPLFPRDIRTFVDIFSGGANVGINVKAREHIFNDMNTRVNEMFRLFQSTSIDTLLRQIDRLIAKWNLSKTNERGFLEFRDTYNAKPDPLSLYVLSSYSYNYQFRFNSKLEFNNPFGRNRSYFSANMRKNLIAFCDRLKSINAKFTDYYFDQLPLDDLEPTDFVYFDPPYLITTGSYNDGNRGFKDWNAEQEQTLLALLSKLTSRRIPWALSNVLEHKGKANLLLSDYVAKNPLTVHELDFDYDNSSHNSKARGSREVLVTNYQLDCSGHATVTPTIR